ncbi:MAG: MazG nucleotide pyrophosphohydrolase domain-containing protein [Candidatus Paceibacterota bacterium]
MEFKSGSVSDLQKYIAHKLKERGFDDESLHERLILLTEEVGELMRACRKASGMNVDQKREIENKVGEELADVLNMIFAVGIELDIDMEKEFIRKTISSTKEYMDETNNLSSIRHTLAHLTAAAVRDLYPGAKSNRPIN